MTRLRRHYQWYHVVGENKRGMKFAIKQKIKGVLGVLRGDASKVFVGKPSDTLELIFDQKSGIYGYLHCIVLLQR